MRKIAITGATGMIGSAIVRRALERGLDVLCIVREDTGRLDNLPKSERIEVAYSDIAGYARLDVSGGCDVFYHLAWAKTSAAFRDDIDTHAANIRYTLDAVRLAKRLGCKKFVGAGSQAEYGIVTEPLKPDTPVNPQSGYGAAKYAAGKLGGLLCSQLGLQFNWLRILSVYGPLDGAQTLIMYALRELRAGRSPELTKCEQTWDYLHCDDAAGAFLAVGDKGVDGKTYPLGSGRARRLSEYLEALRDVVNPAGELLFGKKEYYPHQPMYLCADISELTADTGWRPEVAFEDGVKQMNTPPPPPPQQHYINIHIRKYTRHTRNRYSRKVAYMTDNPIVCEDIQTILSEAVDWNRLSGKTVLVTGANGFIPSYVVYTLLELNRSKFKSNPITILALVRNGEKAARKFAQEMSNGNFRLIVSDVSLPVRLDEKADIIIHAASQASPKYYGVDPVGTLKANTIGTANMLESARNNGVERFLYVSSGEVYGVLDGGLGAVTESYTGNVDITSVRSCYAESKRMGENMCVCWSYQYGFHVNMLRLSHTYGPGVELDDGRVFGDFVKNVIHNEDIVLNSDGRARRGFVYITDMLAGLFRVLFDGENRHAYNVAAEAETEIRELASMLCGLYPEKKLSVRFNGAAAPAGYIRSASSGAALSTEKLKKLGWRQKVSIEQGFRRMIESYAPPAG